MHVRVRDPSSEFHTNKITTKRQLVGFFFAEKKINNIRNITRVNF